MFSWKELMRSWLKPARRRPVRADRALRLGVESLELRDVPSISTSGTPPVWQSVGPAGIQNAGGVDIGTPAQNIEIGAVNQVAVDPFNSNHVAVAAVNGGVWTTNNYTNPGITWTTTTDNLPSLAISSVAFSPVTPGVLYAGTGSYTAGGGGGGLYFAAGVTNSGVGGAPVGIYKSTDGGTTWAQFGASTFANLRVRDIVPTALNGGNTVFADTSDGGTGVFGIYQSDDGGANWTRLSGSNGLPDLGVTSFVRDLGNANRFYAVTASTGSGGAAVYMLDVTGGNTAWVNVTNNLPSTFGAGTRILLATTAAGVDPVYAAVVDQTSTLRGVYRAVPFSGGSGTSPTYVWTAIGPGGLPPDISAGQQSDLHLGIVADPLSDHIVYVAGDRTKGPISNGFPGDAVRGDAIADTWTALTLQPNPVIPPAPGTVNPTTPNPPPTTAPHADFRSLTFTGNNTIIAGTDGGVYQLTNTNPPSGSNRAPVWTSVNANLAITEVYQAAVYNPTSSTPAGNVYMAGAQDNGQSEARAGQAWKEVQGGDGVIVRADLVNKFEYYSAQNFFLAVRNPNGTITFPAEAVNGTGVTLAGSLPFLPAMVLNQAQPALMLVGGPNKELFLSSDHANTFTSLGGVAGGLPSNVPNITSTPVAIAFGTANIRFAAYVASDDGNISQSFDVTSANGNFVLTNFKQVAGGLPAISVVMDPNNPLIAYAVTQDGVFRTTDGSTWTELTGNLTNLVSPGGLVKLDTAVLLPNGGAGPVLLVGGYGGVYQTNVNQLNGGSTVWIKFGGGIPNVTVSDLQYDAASDTLVAGTYGRGVWALTGASTALTNGPVVTVTGGGGANNLAVYPDPTDSSKFVVSDGLGNVQSFSLNAYRKVVLNGSGGPDTITIGAPAPGQAGQTTPLGLKIIVIGGGHAGDTLVIQDAADPTAQQVTLTATTIGTGVGDTLLGTSGAVTYTGLDKGSIQFRLGAGGNQFAVNDSATQAAATYTITASQVTRSLGGTYTYSGGIGQLAVTGGAAPDVFNIQSTPAATTVTGGGNNDVFNVASDAPADTAAQGSLGGQLTLTGGGGVDAAQVNGTAGTDPVTATVTATGTGILTGLPQAVAFNGLTSLGFNGLGGSNSFQVVNSTGTAFGTPTTPTAGIVFAPSGAGAGTVRVGSAIQFGLSGITAGLTVTGGGADTLTVLGTSAPGLQSANGEAAVGNGVDNITASDSQVSVTSTFAGPLLGLTVGTANGTPSVSTLYVATGNHSGATGDQVTVTPSGQLNLVVDGRGTLGSPGNKITITGPGPFTSTQTSDPTLGPPQTRFTAGDGTTVGVIGFSKTSLPGSSTNSGMIAVASDRGPETVVQVFDRLTGALRFQVTPFPGFTGGASVASGDLTGDGIADLIVGAGPGAGPAVEVFSGLDGSLMYSFFAYEPTFTGGVNVAAADITGAGHADIIIGSGVGGGPRVRVLDGITLAVVRDTFVYESTFRGGVNVATGDVNGDGTPDVITSAGAGGGPRVVVLDGKTFRPISSFFAFDPNSRTGFSIAAGNVTGSGRASVIVGAGRGVPAQVRVFEGLSGALITNFYVNDPAQSGTAVPSIQFDAGVRVAAADLTGDGIDDIITVKGAGSTPTIRGYKIMGVNPTTNALFPTFQEVLHENAFNGAFGFGLFVGASD
ncbi:MAG: exo-alpha-sialidase [Gemmataceae bacterium]|nr:exo-alpha-sialidase [Gemmataceae bacterium]